MANLPRINCIHVAPYGRCSHPLTPRKLFGGARMCVLINKPSDPRLHNGCSLQIQYTKPPPPPPIPHIGVKV